MTKRKDKNHTIILIDAEKAFDNPAPIYDKNTEQSGKRGSIPQHNKGHTLETSSKRWSHMQIHFASLHNQKKDDNIFKYKK